MAVITWCVPDDIRQNVAGTDQGTGTCATLTDAQLNAAIVQAASKVAGYTGTTWQPDASDPTITPPDLIKTCTVQLATFYGTLVYRKGKDLSAFDPVYLGYQDAMRTLSDINSGKITFDPPTPGAGETSAGYVRNTIPGIFTPRDSGTRVNPMTGTVEPDSPAGAGWPGGWWGPG